MRLPTNYTTATLCTNCSGTAYIPIDLQLWPVQKLAILGWHANFQTSKEEKTITEGHVYVRHHV